MDKRFDNAVMEEKRAPAISGMLPLILTTLIYLGSIVPLVFGIINMNIAFIIISSVWLCVGWIPYLGLKILRPNEAYVLTLFGKYYGTLTGPGYFFVHPFTGAINPVKEGTVASTLLEANSIQNSGNTNVKAVAVMNRRMSLKTMTLNNERQKINDKLGNPIEIGIVVIWRIANTARAAFNVENYAEYLSTQCDSALRNIVRLYPYDMTDDSELGEKSLRGSSLEISQNLCDEIQSKVDVAGLDIIEARITHLAYAPEIAAAMLQRQQASAIVDARQMIVEGAVGMVEMALDKLNESGVVRLDEERKAAMVSNLLVVLCGNKDAQPVVNSGSLY